MAREQARSYSRVSASSAKVTNLTKMLDAAIGELHDGLKDAANKGVSLAVLADLTGYSDGRVWQIVNDYQREGTNDE